MRERKLQPCLRLPNAILIGPAVAAFYTYPDVTPWRDHLARRRGVATGAALARLEHILADLAP
jgi:hypothetical protein